MFSLLTFPFTLYDSLEFNQYYAVIITPLVAASAINEVHFNSAVSLSKSRIRTLSIFSLAHLSYRVASISKYLKKRIIDKIRNGKKKCEKKREKKDRRNKNKETKKEKSEKLMTKNNFFLKIASINKKNEESSHSLCFLEKKII